MSFTPKHLIITTLLAAATGLASAQAVQPAAGESSGQASASTERQGRAHRDGQRKIQRDPAEQQKRMAERHSQRMAELKTQLKISPAQEGAWNSYASAMQPKARGERPSREEMQKLNTPQRIDRMQALQAERAAEMKARGDATKAFYAQLTPDQQKIFDERAKRGPRGEGKRGGKRGERGERHGHGRH